MSVRHRRMQQGLVAEVAELAAGSTTANPPVDHASHGLKSLVSPTFPSPSLRHTLQRFQCLRVVHWARLDQESKCTEPVGQCTLREYGIQEMRVGRALAREC